MSPASSCVLICAAMIPLPEADTERHDCEVLQVRCSLQDSDGWWRRWESNPRPKLLTTESFHAFSRFIFVSSPTLRTDEDAAATSLIDLVIAVQTEQL